MAKHNAKGRSKGLPPYVQLFHWFRKTEAWRSLAPFSKLLYIEIKGRYNGTNNGGISLSIREAMELLGCSNRTAIGSFKELEDRGFIRIIRKGAFDWKTHLLGEARASTWMLTELPQDVPERSLTPSYDFKSWRPPDRPVKKTRVKKVHPKGEKNTPIKQGMGENNTPKGCKNYIHKGGLEQGDGCKILTTINIPYTPSKNSLPSTNSVNVSTALLQSRLVGGKTNNGRR